MRHELALFRRPLTFCSLAALAFAAAPPPGAPSLAPNLRNPVWVSPDNLRDPHLEKWEILSHTAPLLGHSGASPDGRHWTPLPE